MLGSSTFQLSHSESYINKDSNTVLSDFSQIKKQKSFFKYIVRAAPSYTTCQLLKGKIAIRNQCRRHGQNTISGNGREI